MANSISGFQLAQQGINLATSKPASSKNAVTSGAKGAGKSTFKYPLKMMDKETDFLLIKIYDFVPGGFELKNENPFITNKSAQAKYQAKKPLYYISLPIPQSIQDSTSVTWGDDTINPLEAAGLATFNETTKTDPIKAMQKAYSNMVSGIVGMDEGTRKAINNAIGASAVNALGGNVSIQGLISRATGQVLNSNLELLFQGVNLRSFPFTFDFSPRNAPEGEEVKQIIRVLKKSMSPSNGGVSTTTSGGLFIKSPKIFQLEYRSRGGPHPFLNRFKPMALADMSINYTGSGTYATYHNATPVHMQVSLTFKEINPIYAEDQEKAGGVGY